MSLIIRRLWLIFAQSVTVTLAVVFVISLIKPELLPFQRQAITLTETADVNSSSIIRTNLPNSTVGYSEAARKATPSVVNIFTSREVNTYSRTVPNDAKPRHNFGEPFDNTPSKQRSLGSGVIVSSQGYILTNHHVVEGANEIQVALADGRIGSARLVGADPDSDLAVLQTRLSNLRPVTFGHSENVRVGDIVLAIGDPFGVGQTVTMGIVSALGRSRLGINQFENFIQTDAPINPGNSGGALVDTKGNLIGINSAIFSQSGGSQGIGFSIPISLAKKVMEQLIRSGQVIRGWIGVEVRDWTPELANAANNTTKQGALIASILRGGPADHAQIKSGDILIGIDGQPVLDSTSMLNLIAGLPPGNEVTLDIIRQHQPMTLKVTIGKRPRTPTS